MTDSDSTVFLFLGGPFDGELRAVHHTQGPQVKVFEFEEQRNSVLLESDVKTSFYRTIFYELAPTLIANVMMHDSVENPDKKGDNYLCRRLGEGFLVRT